MQYDPPTWKHGISIDEKDVQFVRLVTSGDFLGWSFASPYSETNPMVEVLKFTKGDTAVTGKKLQMIQFMFWSPLQTRHTKDDVHKNCDHLSYLENKMPSSLTLFLKGWQKNGLCYYRSSLT